MTVVPRALDIGPHRYRVALVPDGVLSDAGRVGQCSPERLVIALCEGQAPTQLADSLIHEGIHAILRTMDLEKEVEESICLTVAPGFLAMLHDNPDLVAFLMSTKEK